MIREGRRKRVDRERMEKGMMGRMEKDKWRRVDKEGEKG
jgi:hypothetical protein